MKKRDILLFIVLFLLIGEILVRFDKAYDLLDNAPQIINTKIEENQLVTAVANGDFVAKESQLRIMVIGDSYIHGGGIDPNKKFSKMLLQNFRSNNEISDSTLVLDVSRPSNNTKDNFNSLINYEKVFKPNIVIWAYNFNDILRVQPRIEEKALNQKAEVKLEKPQVPKKRKETALRTVRREAYEFSQLLQFSSAKLQKELKINGFVLPFGEFYFLTRQVYSEANISWIESKKIFADAVSIFEKTDTDFILYKMPEFNLLENNKLFKEVDNSLMSLVKEQPSIIYMDGFEDFKDANAEEFVLSTYDGHPNENAHKKIADKIYLKIKSLK